MVQKSKHEHAFLRVPRQQLSPVCERLLSWMQCLDDASLDESSGQRQLQQAQRQEREKRRSVLKRLSPKLRRSSRVNKSGRSYDASKITESRSFELLAVNQEGGVTGNAAQPSPTSQATLNAMADEPDTMCE